MGFTIFVSQGVDIFLAYPFNAYIFPSNSLTDLSLNLDTINFHKDHRFDFNKWIYQGLGSFPVNKDLISGSSKGLMRQKSGEESSLANGGLSDSSSEQNQDIDITMRTDSDSENGEGIISIDNAEKLFQAMTEFKVPVIGHNPIMDLAFMYSEFCNELPETLPEFKTEIVKLFPMYFSC